MKKYIMLAGLCCLLLTACAQKKTQIRFNIANFNGFTPIIRIVSDVQRVNIDSSSGAGCLNLNLTRPVLADIEIAKYKHRLLYLQPGQEMTVTYNANNNSRECSFSGDWAAENEFLNRTKFYHHVVVSSIISFHNPERALQIQDSVLAVNQQLLDAQPLSSGFKQLESKRLEMKVGNWFNTLYLRKDTATYVRLLRSRMVENPDWLVIPEYCDFMKQAVSKLAMLRATNEQKTAGREALNVAYTLDSIRNPELRSWLLDLNIFPMLSGGGIAGNEKYLEIYRQYVTDTVALRKMDQLCLKYNKVAVGQPCPDFCLKDVDGKEVKLADFRGKYVYIDLWATWCGPCKAEMPALHKLEEQFEKQDLAFVSISVDRNKDIPLWKKNIADMKLGGTQLHLGENWEWVKNFMPTSLSVPRFILLDKEGKIINANMSRPSDTQTAKTLNNLLTNESAGR